MKYTRFFIYFFLLGSCVDPYDVKSDYRESIVVEGMITDQQGPYLVKISKAVPVTDQTGHIEAVTGATISIKDDEGNSEKLTEKSPGNYYTSGFQGVIGRSYSIAITTRDGSTYESTAEKLLAVGDFTNLRYEFLQREPPYDSRQITSKNGFNIYLDSEVLPQQGGRVWWRWTGTFEIFTYPSLKVNTGGEGKNPPPVPVPPYCSGYYVVRGNVFGPRFDCTCCTCWVNQFNQTPLISDPLFVNNGKITDQYIGFVEANIRTMYDKYYLEVEQLSVSQFIYDFWKKVKSQRSNSSNLFQIPPAKSYGNIAATSPNAIQAVGYFAASSVKKHSITLTKANVPYPMLPLDTVKLSCTDVYKNSSTIKPDFW